MKLQLIRSATMRITYNNHCFITDPYFADKHCGRSYTGRLKSPLAELPFSIKDILSGVEAVLVSHVHSDHFDTAAQEMLPKELPIICQSEDEIIIREKGFKTVYPVEKDFLWNGIHIQRILGKHGSGDVLKDMGISSGFLLEANGEPSIYWTGDTVLCDEVREAIAMWKPKIIITHSGGAVWGSNVKILMDDVQTIEVCKLAPQSTVIAVHMDSVDHATVSRMDLREYARKNGIRDEQLIIPADGETLTFQI